MPYQDDMRPLPRPVSPTGRGADACAVARGGKLTRSRRPINPIPRHKRDSHINAEYRRRNKIQVREQELYLRLKMKYVCNNNYAKATKWEYLKDPYVNVIGIDSLLIGYLSILELEVLIFNRALS